MGAVSRESAAPPGRRRPLSTGIRDGRHGGVADLVVPSMAFNRGEAVRRRAPPRDEVVPAAFRTADPLVGRTTTSAYATGVITPHLRVRMYRSVLLTMRLPFVVITLTAIALNLLSVGAAYSLLRIFQRGVGTGLLGFQTIGRDRTWVLLLPSSSISGPPAQLSTACPVSAPAYGGGRAWESPARMHHQRPR